MLHEVLSTKNINGELYFYITIYYIINKLNYLSITTEIIRIFWPLCAFNKINVYKFIYTMYKLKI